MLKFEQVSVIVTSYFLSWSSLINRLIHTFLKLEISPEWITVEAPSQAEISEFEEQILYSREISVFDCEILKNFEFVKRVNFLTTFPGKIPNLRDCVGDALENISGVTEILLMMNEYKKLQQQIDEGIITNDQFQNIQKLILRVENREK